MLSYKLKFAQQTNLSVLTKQDKSSMVINLILEDLIEDWAVMK